MTGKQKNESMVDLMNQIAEFNKINEFMEDEELEKALVMVVKIISRPDVPPQSAVVAINTLQAFATKFAILATWYSTVEKDRAGTVNNTKKQVYYTMKEALDKLVDGLKYSARYNVERH